MECSKNCAPADPQYLHSGLALCRDPWSVVDLSACSVILPSQSLPSCSSKTHWQPDLQRNCQDKKNEEARKENNAGCTLEHPATWPPSKTTWWRSVRPGSSPMNLSIHRCAKVLVDKSHLSHMASPECADVLVDSREHVCIAVADTARSWWWRFPCP